MKSCNPSQNPSIICKNPLSIQGDGGVHHQLDVQILKILRAFKEKE
ncbi:hypothetical protein [Methanobacterium aggregans]|nr:hypothetical protein [Methanobacterium aggregans]MBP2047008.1 hypothetical protein [Methanobacterium aggregans]